MYLKKIEMQGFKSFADKTTLEFEDGITAVIGPNGSGKSNISDAIRWVLGEQSIKTLRGSKLEDVIFAGTQARKSLGFAEVNMTIDNSDARLPIDYSEVTVTRRVYRSGESEFFINKNQCRLKDIVELFMDTGIGRDGYSIIGQGKIDEILSNKSEERRNIFEEAAGIVKYRTRKAEAEKKIDNTRQNLTRINDIITEIEGQLGPLENQAEKAKKFLEIRDNLKYLEVGLLINNIAKSKQKLEEVETQTSEILAQIEDETNKLESFQTQKEELRVAVENIISEIESAQASIFEFQNNIEKQKAEINVLSERIQNNITKYDMNAEDIEKLNARKTELEKDKEDREHRKERLFADKKRFEDELKEKEEEFAKLSENFSNEQKHIEEKKAKILSNMDLKFEKMSILTDISANVEASNRRSNQIDEEIRDNIHELDKERMVKEEANVLLNEVTSKKNKLTEKMQALSKERDLCINKINELEEAIKKADSDYRITEARHKFLVETENEFEGYNRAVKEVLAKCQKDNSFGSNIYGAVASLIQVPPEYEVAIEMTLGAMIQNVVTETENDAKRAIEYLKENNLGRASFLPIAAVKPGKISQNFKNDDGVIGIASDLVKYDSKFENIIQNLLGKTVIVDNMNNAVNLSKKYKYAFKVVTLEGDVINPSGQMTGGSVAKKTTSLLSRGREIKELDKKLKELQQIKDEAIASLEKYEKDSETTMNDYATAEKEAQVIEVDYAREAQKMNEINNNIDRYQKKINLLKGEKEKLLENLETEKQNEADINSLIEGLEKENAELQVVVDEFSSKNEEQQKIIDDLNSDIMDLKISVSSFDESSLSIDEMVQMIEQEINNCVQNVENKTSEREALLIENEKMQGQISEIQSVIDNSGTNASEIEKKVSELKETRENKNKELVNVEEGITNEFKTLEILREQNNKLEVRKSKLDTDIETIQNKMWEEYETTPNTATNYAEVTSTTQKEVDKLKSEMRALGTVNVNAVEEYKALKERYDFLFTQRSDLEESEKSLNKIIDDMTRLMKIQFAEQFELINKNFTEVFTDLFGGGKANLKLADESNILECGIEIEVQPPGKKLQNMMLLSGGERALTAIALLFAILKLNPSPFCVLDEIEAALDDVNVHRYADFLKKFSKDTQFLIITHRKGTMEAANTMYGVTMEERGISKLLSIKL
ncbi:MAG: chromosome segregation protein SMC [Clostridia bacterium]|nr:chromosome segregation protein SMC [Clostridia bacterium]